MLTEKIIRELKPNGREQNRSDDTGERSGARLVLLVRANGAKLFRVRRRVHGRWKWSKLGDWPEMSLEQARAAFREAISRDPVPKPTSEPSRLYGSIGALCEAYCMDMQLRDRKSWEEVQSRLVRGVKDPFPHLWSKPARDVSTEEVTQVLAHHIRRGVRVQVNRLRSWLHAAYQYGLTAENDPKHKRVQRFGLEFNPVSHIPKQRQWERAGEQVLEPEAFRLVWEHLPDMRERHWSAAPLVLLVIATAGQRITSLLQLRTCDVHLERRLLDIPSSAMKGGKPHVVPLNDQAVQVLGPLLERSRRLGTPFLFPNKSDYSRIMLLTSQSRLVSEFRKEYGVNWRTSWVRRTAKTVLGEMRVSKFDRDRLHGHAVQDVSGRHYDRYDYLQEKRAAMRLWGEWLDGVFKGVDIRLRYLEDLDGR